jgi:hypothetical protein
MGSAKILGKRWCPACSVAIGEPMTMRLREKAMITRRKDDAKGTTEFTGSSPLVQSIVRFVLFCTFKARSSTKN